MLIAGTSFINLHDPNSQFKCAKPKLKYKLCLSVPFEYEPTIDIVLEYHVLPSFVLTPTVKVTRHDYPLVLINRTHNKTFGFLDLPQSIKVHQPAAQRTKSQRKT